LKALSLAVLIIAVFGLVACGNGGDADVPVNDNTPEITDSPQQSSVFSFKMGDVPIIMDEDMSVIIDKLGEPLGVLEQPSCAFEGIDRIFRYSGVEIYTYPKGDVDHIHTISFINDSVYTTEGRIRLGANIQDAIDVYGNNYQLETGMYTFTRGQTFLRFLVNDDIIIGITYNLQLDL